MPERYNLIKDGVVVNSIVADEDFIKVISKDYDKVELVLEPVPEPISSTDTNIIQPAPLIPIISPVEFKMLFTPQERVAIKEARSADLVLEDFFSLIDDPRLTAVNRNLPQVVAAMDYFVSKKLITEKRKGEILNATI